MVATPPKVEYLGSLDISAFRRLVRAAGPVAYPFQNWAYRSRSKTRGRICDQSVHWEMGGNRDDDGAYASVNTKLAIGAGWCMSERPASSVAMKVSARWQRSWMTLKRRSRPLGCDIHTRMVSRSSASRRAASLPALSTATGSEASYWPTSGNFCNGTRLAGVMSCAPA